MAILEVRGLELTLTRSMRGFRRQEVKVLDGLDLQVEAAGITAVVGASGSGKSLLAHAVLGILPEEAKLEGELLYKGEPLTLQRQEELRGREIVLVPQSVSYLNPTMRVGRQVRGVHLDKEKQRVKQRQAFARYGLPQGTERLYPFELSGGMARRVLLAAATISEAQLIIADEPTPGLPQEGVQEVLNHLRELADEGSGVLLITHDIAAALTVADRIVVFYAGTSVEAARASDFAGGGEALRHPYSRALWQALPQNGFQTLPGVQPLPHERPQGCHFAPRCPMATEECAAARPNRRELRGGWVRCFHAT